MFVFHKNTEKIKKKCEKRVDKKRVRVYYI